MQGRSSPRRVGEEVEGAQCWAHGVGHRVVEVRVSPPEPDAAISGRSGNYAHASRGCKPSQGCVLGRPRTFPVRELPASLPCSVFAGESRPYFPERPLVSRIVVGIDGSEEAGAALAFAIEEAKLRKLPLRIVCAWSIPAIEYPGNAVVPTPDLAELAEEHANTVLREAVATVGDRVIVEAIAVAGAP